VEVFIGPPGVGKTTTIAKIAAQERARRGNRLGLVAADGYRVGAVEQLRIYAHLLGSPLSVARTPYELQTAIEAAGIDTALARQGAAAQPPDRRRGVSARTLSATLAKQLAPLVAPDDRYAPVEVFIGPPGVGKTTTIAKIAAQERARRGNRLGLVAADGYRVGAVEQLRIYAHLLGSPLSVARTPYELLTALEVAAVPVLVDTAGRSHTDDGAEDMLRVVASRSDVRTHLVLAADTPLATMQKTVDRFARARPSRVVLTKVDETESLAPLVSFLRERRLMVSYLGVGQRVPDDLHVATPHVFAGWVAGDAGARGAVA
jgi:flagellar biosynthesis protein FlhF